MTFIGPVAIVTDIDIDIDRRDERRVVVSPRVVDAVPGATHPLLADAPRNEPSGRAALLEDASGNRRDLIEAA